MRSWGRLILTRRREESAARPILGKPGGLRKERAKLIELDEKKEPTAALPARRWVWLQCDISIDSARKFC